MNPGPSLPSVAEGADALTRAEAALLVLGIVAAGIAVDGALMILVGPGSFFPEVGSWVLLPTILVVVGALTALGAFLGLGRRTGSVLGRAVPRLFPFAPLWANAGLFVLVLVGAVSVFHGFFDVFTSAHSGGNVSQLTDQGDLSALLIGASVVVWLLTLYAVAVMFRVFRLGRAVDAQHRERDVYGRPIAPPELEPVLPRGRMPSPPAPPRARSVLIAVTVLLALVISAAIQILEVDVGPAPAIAWLWAQPFTPLLSLPVATAISLVDRGIRDLERRYVAVAEVRRAAAPAPVGDR